MARQKGKLLRVLMVCMAGLGLTGIPTAVGATGLVAYYPFNGNANDESDGGYNGTAYGSTSFTDNAGTFNTATSDSSGYLQAAAPINRDTSITVSAWVKPTNIDSTYPHTIAMERSSSGSDYCGVNSAANYGIQIYTGKFSFEVATLDSSGTCTYKRIFATSLPTLDQYSFVTATFDKTAGKMSLYINGALETQATAGNALRTWSDAVLKISRNSSSAKQPWHGDLDEIRIYDRALSSAEILQLYANGRTTSCSSTSSGTYDSGYTAGKAYCVANPSACGISSGTSSGSSTRAAYDPISGLLRIPYVDVPSAFGGNITYSVDLSIINSNPLQFQLQGATQVTQ